MTHTNRWIRRVGLTLAAGGVASGFAVGSAMAATGAPVLPESGTPDLFFATSEIAQVILSIAAVGFAVLAARAYGGEIGRAIYTVSGGVVLFSTWQLLNGASQLLQWQRPPAGVGSTINLVVTILLLAGFYMLYETVSGATTA